MNLDILYVFIYSYILGSIPFGLIITKLFLGKDIRNIGSGNIGTTNVLRTGNKSLATATLVLDILKGYISIFIAHTYFSELSFCISFVLFEKNLLRPITANNGIQNSIIICIEETALNLSYRGK